MIGTQLLNAERCIPPADNYSHISQMLGDTWRRDKTYFQAKNQINISKLIAITTMPAMSP